MTPAHQASAIALLVLSILGCTTKQDSSDGVSGAAGMSITASGGSVAPSGGGGGAGGAGVAGMTAGMTGGATGGAPAGSGGVGGMVAAGSGGMAPTTDAGSSGVGADAGEGDAMVIGEIPDPVAAPYTWGFGLGVSDMAGAVHFYTNVMKMTVEKEVDRGDRLETILYATQAERGARLVLMKYDDNRETRKVTAKLVWQSSDSRGVNQAAATYPDYVSRISFPVYQFDGPDTYIQEVAGIFDTGGGAIEVPYLIALGFSVSDLTASRAFYRDTLKMVEESLGTFPVTDATGSGTIVEYSERLGDGPGIVLQDWSPERNSKDNPVKVVLFVPDAQMVADAVAAAGGTIVETAARTAVYDNRLLIVAKDRDGYLIEIVQ